MSTCPHGHIRCPICAREEVYKAFLDKRHHFKKVAGPVLGYRTWWAKKVRDPETRLWDMWLTSLTFDGILWEGPVMRAPHLTPGDLRVHGAGVYSYKTLEEAIFRLDGSVFGEIEYRGLVGSYRLGWRGEEATIRRLFVFPGRWSKTLKDASKRPTTIGEGGYATFAKETHGALYYLQKRPPFTIRKADPNLIRALELKYQCDVIERPIEDFALVHRRWRP